MTMQPGRIDGLTDLRHIDPAEAETINLILLLLDGQISADGSVVTAQITQKAGHGWFQTSAGAAFQVNRVKDKTIVLDESRIVDAVEALDAVNDLLDCIEQCLGVALEPVAIAPDISNEHPVLQISTEQQQITLSLPLSLLDKHVLQDRAKNAAPMARDMPCLYELGIVAAYLEIDEAANLAPGDLLLVTTPAKAQLIWAIGVCTGLVDLTKASFTPHGHDGDDMMSERSGSFRVPVTITLPQQTSNAEALGGLKPGSTLALGPITNGLQVNLAVAGRSFASGELVQVGDQFAVLIEQRIDMDDLTPDEPALQEEDD
jgi:Type III flagellar switch regulator (C-ring) FliN C-term